MRSRQVCSAFAFNESLPEINAADSMAQAAGMYDIRDDPTAHPGIRGYVMRFGWDELRRVFSITDVPSARLMRIKARALYLAGAITPEQRADVNRRANAVILGKLGSFARRRAIRQRSIAQCEHPATDSSGASNCAGASGVNSEEATICDRVPPRGAAGE